MIIKHTLNHYKNYTKALGDIIIQFKNGCQAQIEVMMESKIET